MDDFRFCILSKAIPDTQDEQGSIRVARLLALQTSDHEICDGNPA